MAGILIVLHRYSLVFEVLGKVYSIDFLRVYSLFDTEQVIGQFHSDFREGGGIGFCAYGKKNRSRGSCGGA